MTQSCAYFQTTAPYLYVYAPSGAVRDPCALRRGVERLHASGWCVELDAAVLASHERFAGDDATRLAAIARAAASQASVALIARGGYGLTRLLHDLPYAAIAQSIAAGTRWVGFSDFTALQMGLLAWAEREGIAAPVTWAGPALLADFGCEREPNVMMQGYFNRLIHNSKIENPHNPAWELRWPLSTPTNLENTAKARAHKKPFWAEVETRLEPATLWGGNLTVLSSLIGTPWLPKITDGILFLEDVGEHPYRIERMLTQLLNAGILHQQRAILLGQFSDYQLSSHDQGFDMPSVIEWLRKQLSAQCILLENLPFGHVSEKAILPVGGNVQLTIHANDAHLKLQ